MAQVELGNAGQFVSLAGFAFALFLVIVAIRLAVLWHRMAGLEALLDVVLEVVRREVDFAIVTAVRYSARVLVKAVRGIVVGTERAGNHLRTQCEHSSTASRRAWDGVAGTFKMQWQSTRWSSERRARSQTQSAPKAVSSSQGAQRSAVKYRSESQRGTHP